MRPDVLPVSVVIPAYRRPEMLERALRSALAQRCRADELLVVDDASGDDTAARASALGAQVVRHEDNQGEGAARNTGIRAARNDWIALLDCDDEWLPDHLATVWVARDSHVLVGSAALGTGARRQDHRVYGWTGPHPRVLRSPVDVLVPENKLVPSAVLLKRETALAVGGFRRGMPRAADLDMWVRMLESGSALAIPAVTALYHVHPGQVSSSPEPMWSAHRGVIDSYTGRPWLNGSVVRRYEGAVAWDQARAAWASGGPRIRTALTLGARLTEPRRLAGLIELLVTRRRGRRLAAGIPPAAGAARAGTSTDAMP